MKILKPGENFFPREYKCTGIDKYDEECGAILLVEEEDIYTIKLSSGLDDSQSSYQVFECPSCQAETCINGLPRRIFDKVKNRKKPKIKKDEDDYDSGVYTPSYFGSEELNR